MLHVASIFKQPHILKMQIDGIRVLSPWLLNRRSTACGCSDDKRTGSGSTGKHQITYKPYVPLCLGDHDHKNMRLRRPMSPHLTIYAPTLTAATSIFQRITGVILSIYATFLAGGSLFLTNGIETYVSMIQSLDLSRPSLFIIKILVGAPFAFHYFNGIRFCAWNAGHWLAKKDIFSTAFKSWIAAAALTFLFAIL